MEIRIPVLLLAMSILVSAQMPTGAIEGVVLDPSEAFVPNASVSVIEEATMRTVSLNTNGEGRYSVQNLAPGYYTVRIHAPGFATWELHRLKIDTGSVASADATLPLGPVEQVLTINATETAVDLVRNTVDTVITQTDIESLPLSSRNYLDFASLAPGVRVAGAATLDPTKSGPAYRAIGISGRAGAGTRIQIDGIDVTDDVNGSTMVNVSSDTVQEFQLSRSSLDVTAPMTSSGAVSVITRSGSNEIHGRGFLDYFNEHMSARKGYEPSNAPAHQTRAGISAGGPFIRSRLFWFANWDRNDNETQWQSVSPLWPQLESTTSVPGGIQYFSGRLDWNLHPSVRAYYSFAGDSNKVVGGSLRSPYTNANWSALHTVGVDAVHGRWTHSYRFGFVNFNNRIESDELSIPFHRTPQGMPYFLGVGSYSIGPNANAPQKTGQSSIQNHYTGGTLMGRHTLRFGGSLNSSVVAAFVGPSGLAVYGSYNSAIAAQIVARKGNPQDPFEYPLASFGTALLPQYLGSRSGHGFASGAQEDTRFGLFFSDSWKVTRRLALNFAVRNDYSSGYFGNPEVRREPLLEKWIPGAAAPLMPPKLLLSPSFGFAWAPAGNGRTVLRGGFAMRREGNLRGNLDQLTMLPASFGGSYAYFTQILNPDGSPFNIDGRHPTGNYQDLQGRRIGEVIDYIGQIDSELKAIYSGLRPDPSSGPSAFEATHGTVMPVFPGNQYKLPYSLQFNFGAQHELGRDKLLSVDYVHNRAIGLPRIDVDFERQMDSEFLDVQAASAQIKRVIGNRTIDEWIAANPTRTISAFSLATEAIWPGRDPAYRIASFYTGGFTTYKGLQVSFRGRHSRIGPLRSAAWFLAYTLSRSEASNAALNSESWMGNAATRDNRNPNSRATFGPSSFDVTHLLSLRTDFVVPGGFRLGSVWAFSTPSALSLAVPLIGTATATGSNGVFSVDLNGDARPELLPGLGAGQFGRRVKSLKDVNNLIAHFNNSQAGTLTAHGQALVAAGLFTESQLKKLGAMVSPIPAIPLSNPSPWNNAFFVNLRVERPVRIGERFLLQPFATINNLFNHAPPGPYTGLTGSFGSLNYNYATAPPGNQLSDLTRQRGRLNPTRLIQIGVRLDF